MPTRRATWLPLAAVVANGLLVGVSLDQSIKQLPARHRIGVTAFAADFVLQPGVVAGLVPWWLTDWPMRHPAPSWAWTPLRAAGVALVATGVIVLMRAFVRFVVEGLGTAAPIAPTQRLVVGGIVVVVLLILINVVGIEESTRVNVVLAVVDFATQVLLVRHAVSGLSRPVPASRWPATPVAWPGDS